MVNRLMGRLERRARSKRLSGIGVAVKLREVTAGDINPHAVALLENDAGADQVDFVLVNSSRLEQLGLIQTFAVARPDPRG